MRVRGALRIVSTGVLLVALSSCDDSGTPNASDTPTNAQTTEASDGTETTATPSDSPTVDPDLACLSSHTWRISKPDLENQIEHLMSSKMQDGASVDSVRILSGDQTLEVTPDLEATFTDDTVTEIKAHFVSNGTRLNMVVTQTHSGTASGAWKAVGPILTPRGGWSGGIHGTTQVSINGRSSSAPFGASAPDAWANLKLNYDCSDGSLMVTIPGVSPFNYLFR